MMDDNPDCVAVSEKLPCPCCRAASTKFQVMSDHITLLSAELSQLRATLDSVKKIVNPCNTSIVGQQIQKDAGVVGEGTLHVPFSPILCATDEDEIRTLWKDDEDFQHSQDWDSDETCFDDGTVPAHSDIQAVTSTPLEPFEMGRSSIFSHVAVDTCLQKVDVVRERPQLSDHPEGRNVSKPLHPVKELVQHKLSHGHQEDRRQERMVSPPMKLESSFHRPPQWKKTSPVKYKYQNAPVRGAWERQKLQGFACSQCEDALEYILDLKKTDKDYAKIVSKVSRHRSKHGRRAPTPPGYWEPGWVSPPKKKKCVTSEGHKVLG